MWQKIYNSAIMHSKMLLLIRIYPMLSCNWKLESLVLTFSLFFFNWHTFCFLHARCSLPKELPTGVQEDVESSFQGLCARLHPSLRQHLQHGGRGSHQHLLQTLLLLHLRVQPHWSLWARAIGKSIVWPLFSVGVTQHIIPVTKSLTKKRMVRYHLFIIIALYEPVV